MSEDKEQEVVTTETAEFDVNVPRVCKRCGRPHLEKDIEVDEATLREYTRCALGGRIFSKTFSVCNGELNVTLSALPAEFEVEVERLATVATSDIQTLDIRLLLSLTEIKAFDADTSGFKTIYSADIEARKKILENPKQAMKDLAEKVDAILLGVLRRMSATFIILQNAILETLVNKDFYEGVGLV